MHPPTPAPQPAPQPKKPSWTPPPSWILSVLQADGTVIASVSRCPHGPAVVIGDPALVTSVIDEVRFMCRLFKHEPPFVHGKN